MKYGSEKCCTGCSFARQEGCYMCGQCDELDPCLDLDMFDLDAGEPDGDPSDYFCE